MNESLWGDLPNADNLRTPLFVLKEQADVLTEQTKGVLLGNIKTKTAADRLVHYLQIVAPVLNNYAYTVLSVHHGITQIYPATVVDPITGRATEVADEKQFRDSLGKVLSSDTIHKVVSGLLAQSRDSI